MRHPKLVNRAKPGWSSKRLTELGDSLNSLACTMEDSFYDRSATRDIERARKVAYGLAKAEKARPSS